MPRVLDLDYGLMADTLGAQADVIDEPLALAEHFAAVECYPEAEVLALKRVRLHLRAAEHELRALTRAAQPEDDPHVS
jgi:hypothetical protein